MKKIILMLGLSLIFAVGCQQAGPRAEVDNSSRMDPPMIEDGQLTHRDADLGIKFTVPKTWKEDEISMKNPLSFTMMTMDKASLTISGVLTIWHHPYKSGFSPGAFADYEVYKEEVEHMHKSIEGFRYIEDGRVVTIVGAAAQELVYEYISLDESNVEIHIPFVLPGDRHYDIHYVGNLSNYEAIKADLDTLYASIEEI